MPKTVAVIGASPERRKYGNKSLRAHQSVGWNVVPINPTATEVEGHRAFKSVSEVAEPIDRVTMYVPPPVGIKLLEEIAAKKPAEFWLNPGTESRELIQRAKELGLDPILGCSIIDLGVSPADFP
jgi:uncharacterized protein